MDEEMQSEMTLIAEAYVNLNPAQVKEQVTKDKPNFNSCPRTDIYWTRPGVGLQSATRKQSLAYFSFGKNGKEEWNLGIGVGMACANVLAARSATGG